MKDRATPDLSHIYYSEMLSSVSPTPLPIFCLYLTALWARQYIAWPRLHPKKRFVEKIFVAGLRLRPVFPASLSFLSIFSFSKVLFRIHLLHQILISPQSAHKSNLAFAVYIIYLSSCIVEAEKRRYGRPGNPPEQ